MKTVSILIYFIYCGTLLGQKIYFPPPIKPFEQASFANLNPTWHLDIFDSTRIRTDTFDGYNEFDFVYTYGDHIKDGKLYKSHAIRNYDYMGFRVSCVDIATGALLWAQNIDYDAYKRQHTPYYQTFDADGNLVIIGFKKTFPYDPKENNWFIGTTKPSKVFRLTLDADSGEVLSYFSPDTNADLKISTNNGFDNWNFFGLDESGKAEFLLDIYNLAPNANKLVRRGCIGPDGVFTIIDSLVYSPSNWDKTRSSYAKKDGSYYTLEHSKVNSSNHLVILDTNLVEIRRIDITHLNLEIYKKYLFSYTNEYLIFVQIVPNSTNNHYRYLVMDYDGHLMQTFETTGEFHKKYITFITDYDNKLGKLVIFAYGNNKDYDKKELRAFLDVLQYDGVEFKLYKSIRLTQPNIFFEAAQLFYDGDENLLLAMQFGLAYYDENLNPPFWPAFGNKTSALMKVSRKELGLEPSVTQETAELAYTHCYPNPSSGAFYLDMDAVEGKKDIRIFDISGRNVYVEADVVRTDISLDLSDLPSGQYVYQVYIGSKVHAEGVWVKL
jgi:hypothetical protein